MRNSTIFEVSLLTENEKGQLKGGFKRIETLSVKAVVLPNSNCYGSSEQAPSEEPANTNCHSSCKCNA